MERLGAGGADASSERLGCVLGVSWVRLGCPSGAFWVRVHPECVLLRTGAHARLGSVVRPS